MPNHVKDDNLPKPNDWPTEYFMRCCQFFLKWRRVLIACALAVFTCWLIAFGVLRFYVIPSVGQYKNQIEVVASKAIKKTVTIEKLYGGWDFLAPQVVVENLKIADATGQEKLKLNRVVATVSWLSIFKMEPYLSALEIFDPNVVVRRDVNGQIYVAGILIEDKETKDFTALNWVFSQGSVAIHDGTLRWIDETRGATLDVNNLNATLSNSFNDHDFEILGVPSSDIVEKIDITGSLSHPFFAKNVGDVETWDGQVTVNVDKANLITWQRFVTLPVNIQKGIVSGKVIAYVDNKIIQKVAAQITTQEFFVDWKGKAKPLHIDEAKANILIQGLFSHSLKEWSVDVKEAYVKSATGPNINHMDVSVLVRQDDEEKIQALTVGLEHINLSALKDALFYIPLPNELKKQAQSMVVSGQIASAKVDWEETGAYHVKANLIDVSIHNAYNISKKEQKELLFAWPNQLGFENLSGQFEATEEGGEVILKSKNTVLYLPLYSDQAPMMADKLNLKASWKIQDGVLNAQLDDMAFHRFGMKLSARGQYSKDLNQDDDIGTIDMAIHVDRLNVTDVKHFIPLQTPKALAQWLSQGLQGGLVNDADIVIKGNLNDFPFEKPDSTGIFTVNAPLEEAILNFAPQSFSADKKRPLWPVLEKINGAFTMNANTILIHADTAMTHGAKLSDVDVAIKDVMHDATLDITGKASGQMQNFIDYVNDSPVVQWISRFTETIQTTGETTLDLKMRLPLEHMDDVVVKGQLEFLENNVTLFEDLPTIENVTGTLTFTEKGFYLDRFNGKFLHEAVSIDGGTQSNGQFLVKGRGTLSAHGLQKTYTTGVMKSLIKLVSGSTPFDVAISNGQVKVESSLAGFRINFPAPLGKGDEAKKLTVILKDKPSRANVAYDELTAQYGDILSTRYLRHRIGRGDWAVYRGGIGIMTQPVPQENLSLRIGLPKLNLNEWMKKIDEVFVNSNSSSSTSTGPKSKLMQYVHPRHYFINAHELKVSDALLTNVKLNSTLENDEWRSNIVSDQLTGSIVWVDKPGEQDDRIIARLKSFVIEQKSFSNVAGITRKSEIVRIPTIDVVTEHMSIFGIDIGKTEISAHNVEKGGSREWVISKLKVTNPDAQLSATGVWKVDDQAKHETVLNYQMDISNAGHLLSRLGYKKLLKKGTGTLKGEVQWKNLPYKVDVASMVGNLEMKISSGQFLKVDPGAAKLLGVLSMQSITNRLTLDFRDIFSKGFAFDEITVNAQLLNGRLKTDNFKMNGITASVLMNGYVDIVKETQDLHVVVLPQIDAGMASLAYGFINPAIGVGTFLAQMVVKQPVMKELASEYQITGDLKNPQFKEIKVGKKASKKKKEQQVEN